MRGFRLQVEEGATAWLPPSGGRSGQLRGLRLQAEDRPAYSQTHDPARHCPEDFLSDSFVGARAAVREVGRPAPTPAKPQQIRTAARRRGAGMRFAQMSARRPRRRERPRWHHNVCFDRNQSAVAEALLLRRVLPIVMTSGAFPCAGIRRILQDEFVHRASSRRCWQAPGSKPGSRPHHPSHRRAGSNLQHRRRQRLPPRRPHRRAGRRFQTAPTN